MTTTTAASLVNRDMSDAIFALAITTITKQIDESKKRGKNCSRQLLTATKADADTQTRQYGTRMRIRSFFEGKN